MPRRIDYPTLLVFDEKHSEDIYLLESAEEFYRVAVAKIRSRDKFGEFGIGSVEEIERDRDQRIERIIKAVGVDEKVAPRTVEAVEALKDLPEDELAAKLFGVTLETFAAFPRPIREQSLENAKKALSGISRAFAESEEELQFARDIKRIVETEHAEELTREHRGRSYNLAEWILDSRRDYQYEGYELSKPRSAPSAEELEAKRKK